LVVHSTAVALTTGCFRAPQVDITLTTTATVGSVELELWHGHQVLAAVPLLLLPPAATTPPPDPLLEELQQCIQQLAWGSEPTDESQPPPAADPLCTLSNWVAGVPSSSSQGDDTPSGAGAWVTDLGQLLFTGACIDQQASQGTVSGGVSTGTLATPCGPGSWGGVAASTVTQHTDNPVFLRSMLVLGEGLLELARSQGHCHTVQLVAGLSSRVRDRLAQVCECSLPTSQDDFQLRVITCGDHPFQPVVAGSTHPWSDLSNK
jgi:hypothetical protein